MTNNNFRPNYIICPGCRNVLDLSFKDKCCPNPLCSFNFEGLEVFLDRTDDELHKVMVHAYKGNNERVRKLLATAVRFNIGNYLAHFISCNWGAHYQTLFKDFIILYLDDLNVLKIVLMSDVIIAGKGDAFISKNGYKMFPDLYRYLMRVHNAKIRTFLILEFQELYRKWLANMREKHTSAQNSRINGVPRRLI